MPFYAVVAGRNPGIYTTWDDCKEQTAHYPGAWYKKFRTQYEAKLCMKSKEMFKHLRVPKIHLMEYNTTLETNRGEETVSVNKYEWKDFSYNKKSMQTETYGHGRKVGKKKNIYAIKNGTLSDKHNNINGGISAGIFVPLQTTFPFIPAQSPLLSDQRYVPPLIEDKNGFIDVYIDGAVDRYRDVQHAKGGVGVWFNHGHPLNIAAPLEGTATAINAEIQAATRAIQQAAAAGLTKLNIHTDSLCIINCIKKLMNQWTKKKENNCGDPTNHRVQLEKLNEAIKNMEAVKWTHTRSHQGIEGNEYADSLAHTGMSLNGFKEFNNYPIPEELQNRK